MNKQVKHYPHYSISHIEPTTRGRNLRFHVRIWYGPVLWADYFGCIAKLGLSGEKLVDPPKGFKHYTVCEWCETDRANIITALSNARGKDLYKQLEFDSPWKGEDLEWEEEK